MGTQPFSRLHLADPQANAALQDVYDKLGSIQRVVQTFVTAQSSQVSGGVNVQQGSYTLTKGDSSKLVVFNGSRPASFTFPSANLGSSWFVFINNASSYPLTLSGVSGSPLTIAPSSSGAPDSGALVFSDGKTYYAAGWSSSLLKWTSLTLGTGWSDIGSTYYPSAVSNVDSLGLVHLCGGITNSSFTSGSSVGTWPEPSTFPGKSVDLPVCALVGATNYMGRLAIGSTGAMSLFGGWPGASNIQVFLDGVTFRHM